MLAASCPSTMGNGSGQSPFMTCQSLMHTPAALTSTRTSLAFGGSCSRSRISRGLLAPSGLRPARHFLPVLPARAAQYHLSEPDLACHLLSAVRVGWGCGPGPMASNTRNPSLGGLFCAAKTSI
jgi:hypothetical protein